MLGAAALVLTLTALGGLLLLAMAQRSSPRGRIWLPGAAHGALGLAGAALLVVGLGGPPRGAATGSASFGVIAAWLVGAGLLAGAGLFLGRLAASARLRRVSGLAIGVHATLGVAGLVMLATFLAA